MAVDLSSSGGLAFPSPLIRRGGRRYFDCGSSVVHCGHSISFRGVSYSECGSWSFFGRKIRIVAGSDHLVRKLAEEVFDAV